MNSNAVFAYFSSLPAMEVANHTKTWASCVKLILSKGIKSPEITRHYWSIYEKEMLTNKSFELCKESVLKALEQGSHVNLA